MPPPAQSERAAAHAVTADPHWLLHELLTSHEITRDQHRSALDLLASPKGKAMSVAHTILTLGLATPLHLAGLYAKVYNLATIELGTSGFDAAIARQLPKLRATQIFAIPFRKVDREIHVAVSDPSLCTKAAASAELSGAAVKLFVAPKREILSLIEEVWSGELPDITTMTASDYVARTLALCVAERTSDIHFEPKPHSLDIRKRVDGELIHHAYIPESQRILIINAVKNLAQLNTSEKRVPQDGQAKLTIGSRSFTFRVSTAPTVFGQNAVLRVMDESAYTRSLADQGLSPRNEKLLRDLVKMPNGVIVCTGPTGSGKTTLLHALLSLLDAPSSKIIAIEDPIEYEQPRFTQMPVNAELGNTFSKLLRAALRQDPDYILVGEIRDQDVANVTIQAALTGHLVFTTLHTNDAAAAITRLADIGVDPFLISSSVAAVTAQRLIPLLCPECSLEHPQLEKMRTQFGMPNASFRVPRPSGCPKCNFEGTFRRVGVYEVLPLKFDHSTEIQTLTDRQNAELAPLDLLIKVLEEHPTGAPALDDVFAKTTAAETPEELASLRLHIAALTQYKEESRNMSLLQDRRAAVLARYTGLIDAERRKETEVTDLILRKGGDSAIRDVYRRRGYVTMRADAMEKAAVGLVSLDAVFANAG
jgi:type IV pilus assembly protein PilB